jgi:deoxyribodipyrimidine photo-lyase
MSKTTAADSSSAPSILWFRNDLRLADNPALRAACAAGGSVIPVFILDDEAAGSWQPGGAGRWWLHESLTALARTLKEKSSRLVLRRGEAAEQLSRIAAQAGAASVHCTRRYEPWAIAQEASCKSHLEAKGITLKRYGGVLLLEPEKIATKSGDPYKVYTPFWRALCATYTPSRPQKAPDEIPAPSKWPKSEKLSDWNLQPAKPNWAKAFPKHWTPGEAGALTRLETFIDEAADDYTRDRNRPDLAGTSRLSPHMAHGEISPRLIWYSTRSAQGRRGRHSDGLETFLKELVWREFASHLLFHFPHFPEKPFREEFQRFPWQRDQTALRAWQRGMTGYPIVDAGMRELWTTGWMHNRVRMIVASFLVKDLLIPWQDGERWFWDTLVDADLANNAAGWQWVAGSGADAAPYFRIFNPIMQGEKFDPDGAYVRQWLPELAELPPDVAQRPFEADSATLQRAGVRLGETYPKPIVDHAAARKAALSAYREIRR